MITTTTHKIPGKRIVKTLGLAKGNTIRARHAGHDIMASLKNIVGGEIAEDNKLMGEAREQAMDLMISDAQRMGANAVVGLAFSTSMIMGGAAELLAYGTAVVVEDE